MNIQQLNRCIQRTDRNYQIVAEFQLRDGSTQWSQAALKMGGRKVSHRRVKMAAKANRWASKANR